MEDQKNINIQPRREPIQEGDIPNRRKTVRMHMRAPKVQQKKYRPLLVKDG